MQSTIDSIRRHRLFALAYFLFPVLVTGLTLRIALLLRTWPDVSHGASVIASLLLGVFTDTILASYLLLPFGIYLMLAPQPFFRTAVHRLLMVLAVAFEFWLLIFISASEWIFWDEFGVRFNFIAVDYLVYTQEVIDNILESYPVYPLLLAFAIAAIVGALLTAAMPWFRRWQATTTTWRSRFKVGLPLLLIPVAATAFVNQGDLPRFENRYLQEISHNGAYSFFAAFRNNELDYHDFYLDIPERLASERIHELIAQEGHSFLPQASAAPEYRHVPGGQERRYNVIQIVVESLSAGFLGSFGNTDGLTPNLDELAAESLQFKNLMATGTRTVRGMESLTLSIPPTPGRSIVKRPTNDVLESSGTVFHAKGYLPQFFYGGYGYFDNMNDFFAHNGFVIHDRGTEPDQGVDFANAWGVSDEDLYDWVLADADRRYAEKQPIYDFVMTTSNHRPYTYPEGRIDIPSGSGRNGAVKYTDYAMGRFIAAARTKPWFADTIFVIVADHCASSAGKTALTVANYRIPMLVYAPGIVEPGAVGTLGSQIDVLPTLFSMLGWSYDSEFFGKDLLQVRPDEGRALIGTYQTIGLLDPAHHLTALEPGKRTESFDYDPQTGVQTPSPDVRNALTDTIAYYQSAADLYATRSRLATL